VYDDKNNNARVKQRHIQPQHFTEETLQDWNKPKKTNFIVSFKTLCFNSTNINMFSINAGRKSKARRAKCRQSDFSGAFARPHTFSA